MKYVCLALFLVTQVQASDDWLCKSQATQREGDSFHSCGVAWAKDENGSRLQALENAKTEFASICSASDDCAGKAVQATPGRTDCQEELNGIRCYRSVIFTIGEPVKRTKGTITPFRGTRPTTPVIAKGMTKKDLFAKFGAPHSIIQNDIGDWHSLQVFFKGPMCAFYGALCYATIENGRVNSFADFSPEYTDLMN